MFSLDKQLKAAKLVDRSNFEGFETKVTGEKKDIKNSAATLESLSQTEYSACSQICIQSSTLTVDRKRYSFSSKFEKSKKPF